MIPDGAVFLARGYFLLIGVGLLAGGLAALGIRLELWDAAATRSPDGHARMLAVHGSTMAFVVLAPALFGGVGNLLVPHAMRLRALPGVAFGIAALVLWALGASLLIYAAATTIGWELYAPPSTMISPLLLGAAAVALGLLCQALHLGVSMFVGWRHATPVGRIAAAGIVAPLLWQVTVLGLAAFRSFVALSEGMPSLAPFGEGFAELLPANLVAALAVMTWLVARDSDAHAAVQRRALVGYLSIVLWGLGSLHWTVHLAVFSGELLLVTLWLRLIGRERRWGAAPMLFAWMGAAPMLLVFVPVRSYLTSAKVDVHIHDTVFLVGSFHLGAGVVIVALWAAVLAWAEILFRSIPKPGLTRLGAALLCGGMLCHALAMLALGQQGMPRRYFTYVPTFEAIQRVATIAAFVTATGIVLLIASLIVGRTVASPNADARADR